MESNTVTADTAAPTRVPPAFRQWWASYKQDLLMSPQTAKYVAQWWRDLPQPLRVFLATQSGAAESAGSCGWDAISPNDQTRILVAARQVFSDLKPASWM